MTTTMHDKLISYCQFIFIGALHHFHGGQGIIKPLNQVLTCRNLWSINWKQKSAHFPLYNREAAAKQGILIFSVLKLCPQIFSLFFIKLSLQFKFQLLDFVLKQIVLFIGYFSSGRTSPLYHTCYTVLFPHSVSVFNFISSHEFWLVALVFKPSSPSFQVLSKHTLI